LKGAVTAIEQALLLMIEGEKLQLFAVGLTL
jgi:hypothetical protein